MEKSERNGNGNTLNKPGLYRHPESGAEIVVTHHPKLGSAMADGVVQVGYKWVGPAETAKPSAEPKVEAKK